MRTFTDKHPHSLIVEWLKRQASTGDYSGIMTTAAKRYCDDCRSVHQPSGTIFIFTRDVGMHSSGWWKNPDYERCLHLSLSFRDPETGQPIGKDQKWTDTWIDEVYGPLKTLIWTEPPFYPEGKANDVWHYRVFFAPGWVAPILPRGEVYSRDWTPEGWLSWSDLQAKLGRNPDKMKMEGYGIA